MPTPYIRADILSKLANTKLKSRHRSLLQQTLSAPSIANICHNLTQSQADNWTTPYIQYLQTSNPPPNADKTWIAKVTRYTMIGDDLYKRGYDQPLLKCITTEQVQYIIKELHEGICGYHSSTRPMTTRILRAGYFWPNMEADCQDFVKKLQTMPKTWQPHSPETRTAPFYTIPMALRKVGDGHPRPLLPRQRPSKVLDSSRRLLHQVDRGQTTNHHHSPESPTICLE